LRNQRANLPIQETMKLFSASMAMLDNADLLSMLAPTEKKYIEEKSAAWIKAGAPKAVAMRIASTRIMYSLLNIIHISNETRGNVQQIARLYFELSDRLELDAFREKINDYPADTHWMLLARSAAKGDLDSQQRALTISIYQFNKKQKLPPEMLDVWFDKNAVFIDRWKSIFTDVKSSQLLGYEMLIVSMRELAELKQAAASNL
jgi:glutamate dehydrogenase